MGIVLWFELDVSVAAIDDGTRDINCCPCFFFFFFLETNGR